MKYFDIKIDGFILSKLTSKEIDSQIKLLARKNYQVYDFRKKNMVVWNKKNERQAVAIVEVSDEPRV